VYPRPHQASNGGDLDASSSPKDAIDALLDTGMEILLIRKDSWNDAKFSRERLWEICKMLTRIEMPKHGAHIVQMN